MSSSGGANEANRHAILNLGLGVWFGVEVEVKKLIKMLLEIRVMLLGVMGLVLMEMQEK